MSVSLFFVSLNMGTSGNKEKKYNKQRQAKKIYTVYLHIRNEETALKGFKIFTSKYILFA